MSQCPGPSLRKGAARTHGGPPEHAAPHRSLLPACHPPQRPGTHVRTRLRYAARRSGTSTCLHPPSRACPHLLLFQNFKGATGGVIFRCYPGDYQIYSRTRFGFSLVETRSEMPDLRQVALEVLPRAAAAAAAAAR